MLSAVVDPFTGARTTGASGADASTVKSRGVLGPEALPAGSVWTAVTVWSPSSRPGRTTVQPPPGPTTTGPYVVPSSSVTTTVAPRAPVPATVTPGPVTVAPCVGAVIVGAAGAAVSTVKLTAAAPEVLPAGSVCTAVTVCGPSSSAVVGVKVQPPS